MSDTSALHIPFSTRVVGVSAYQDAVRHLIEGADLVVVAEPDNPFDPNAHVVTHDGVTVGYLSRAVATRMAATGTGPWSATVREVFRRQTWGLEITVTGAADTTAIRDDETSAAIPETHEDEARVAEVVARHDGRVLGAYAGTDPGASVVFFNVAGTRLSVPADLVTIIEPVLA